MVYDLTSRVDQLTARVEFMEYENMDKDAINELEARVYKLENEVSYKDVYIYFTIFYLIYVTSKQLNNMM
jgi:hypothetical protein